MHDDESHVLFKKKKSLGWFFRHGNSWGNPLFGIGQ